jgi:hypothetical protein
VFVVEAEQGTAEERLRLFDPLRLPRDIGPRDRDFLTSADPRCYHVCVNTSAFIWARGPIVPERHEFYEVYHLLRSMRQSKLIMIMTITHEPAIPSGVMATRCHEGLAKEGGVWFHRWGNETVPPLIFRLEGCCLVADLRANFPRYPKGSLNPIISPKFRIFSPYQRSYISPLLYV